MSNWLDDSFCNDHLLLIYLVYLYTYYIHVQMSKILPIWKCKKYEDYEHVQMIGHVTNIYSRHGLKFEVRGTELFRLLQAATEGTFKGAYHLQI